MELGLRPAELEELGPDELPPLYTAWGRRQEREDFRAGVLASIVANANRDPKKTRPFTPASFFPSLAEFFPPDEPEDDEGVVRKLEAALGGAGERSSS